MNIEGKSNNQYQKWIKVGLSILFVGLFVYYYINNPEAITELRKYTVETILIGAILTAVSIMVNGLFLKLVIDKLAKKISVGESIYTSLISTLANYVLPLRGGIAVRAVYLKRKFEFKYSDFIATLYGNYIVLFMINSALALLAIWQLFLSEGVAPLSLVLIMVGILVFSISLASRRIRLDDFVLKLLEITGLSIAKKFSQKIRQVLQGWKVIVHDRQLLAKIIALSVINVSARISLFFVLFQALGLQLSLAQVVLFTVISNLSIFIAITPGAVGVRESLLLIYSGTLMVTSQHILNVSLGERAIMLTTMLTAYGLILSYLWLRGKISASREV